MYARETIEKVSDSRVIVLEPIIEERFGKPEIINRWAIDYFDGNTGLWSRFHFNPKQKNTKSALTVQELLKDRETPMYFLGETDSLPSQIISITASELKEEIEKMNRPCILLCENGIRAKTAADQLSKHFNFPIISWNQNLDSFLLLLNETHV